MLRFVEGEELERDYFKACTFDKVFGTINAFLYRINIAGSANLFWNLYGENYELIGNLSYANDTFTICAKDDSCSREISHFVVFWDRYTFVSYNRCKVKELEENYLRGHVLNYGKIMKRSVKRDIVPVFDDVCKDVNLHSVYDLFAEYFPDDFVHFLHDLFVSDMNYRIRKKESSVYSIVKDGKLASALEIMCRYKKSVVLGTLATHEKHRGKGFASSLLNTALNDYSKSTVYILAENDSAEQLYKKLGFTYHAEWARLSPEGRKKYVYV